MSTKERREHERLPASYPTTLSLRRGVTRTSLEGQVHDVSLGGCQISTEAELDLEHLFGTTLNLRIALNSSPEPFEVTGRVRWVSETFQQDRVAGCRAGVEFLGLRPPEPAQA